MKTQNNMRNLVTWLVFVTIFTALLNACKTIQYVPVEKRVEVAVHDTTYLHRTDTLVEVQKSRISDFSGLLDTLDLETPLARSRAFVDTTAGILRGTLEQSGTIPVKIVWKERVVTRDSLVYQDVPVPVEVEKIVKVVPWFWRFFAFIGIVVTAGLVFWLLRKFKVL